MDKYIHVDITEDNKVKVEVAGTGEDVVLMMIDAICAMAAEYEMTAKEIIRIMDDELEDWE